MWKAVIVICVCCPTVTLCDDNYNRIPRLSISESDHNGSLKHVLREQWHALPPSKNLAPLQLPTGRVIIASGECTTLASCTAIVQSIQKFHMESQFDDIAYNFLVGGDGSVYVGRGWDYQGAHTKGYNSKSICITFIGSFQNFGPTESQLYQAQKLIEDGVKLNKLSQNYALYGHRQLTATQSPGQYLYNIIMKWPHWTEKVEL